MLDEAARIPFEPRPPPQVVLDGREGAEPAFVFDEHTPHGAWDVRPRDRAPAPGEEPAEHDEPDERRV